ncbi:MAG: dolichol-phosphate mannosyltransferase [Verrucomicrobia bacterium]|nr:MAG: dolichol-phosphate mannosyltransferase [Verrucomicrobiota bacterium]
MSVVIPLFNEEENVGPLQAEVAAALGSIDYELILVDDGSSDGTVSKIVRGDRVRVLEFAKNSGQSAAMFAGIMAARGEIIALLDGDLQNDPADVPRLMESIQRDEADLVCGYRANRRDSGFKRIQSRIANAVRSRFTGDGVRDTGCTLKAMRRECREALVPFRGMHRFIPALIKAAGFRVVEVAVHHRARQHGESKYGGGLRRAIPATQDMFGVQWLNSRRFTIRFKD